MPPLSGSLAPFWRQRFSGEDITTAVVTTNYMWPTIQPNSLIFLGPSGYRGETLYSLAYDGEHRGDVRRLSHAAKGYLLTADNAPFSQAMDREEFHASGARPVYGALVPFDHDFGLWMRDRYAR